MSFYVYVRADLLVSCKQLLTVACRNAALDTQVHQQSLNVRNYYIRRKEITIIIVACLYQDIMAGWAVAVLV